MTDRELLELAAKAAGVKAYWSTDGTLQNRPLFVVSAGGGMGTMKYEVEWNPRKDDGVGALLEAALELHVTWHSISKYVTSGTATVTSTQPYEKNRQAARRLATLIAAAEIGKAMP